MSVISDDDGLTRAAISAAYLSGAVRFCLFLAAAMLTFITGAASIGSTNPLACHGIGELDPSGEEVKEIEYDRSLSIWKHIMDVKMAPGRESFHFRI